MLLIPENNKLLKSISIVHTGANNEWEKIESYDRRGMIKSISEFNDTGYHIINIIKRNKNGNPVYVDEVNASDECTIIFKHEYKYNKENNITSYIKYISIPKESKSDKPNRIKLFEEEFIYNANGELYFHSITDHTNIKNCSAESIRFVKNTL